VSIFLTCPEYKTLTFNTQPQRYLREATGVNISDMTCPGYDPLTLTFHTLSRCSIDSVTAVAEESPGYETMTFAHSATEVAVSILKRY